MHESPALREQIAPSNRLRGNLDAERLQRAGTVVLIRPAASRSTQIMIPATVVFPFRFRLIGRRQEGNEDLGDDYDHGGAGCERLGEQRRAELEHQVTVYIDRGTMPPGSTWPAT